MSISPIYQRILLKLSGEALLGGTQFGIEPQSLTHLAQSIQTVTNLGVQLGLVIGGGNIFRGINLTSAGVARVSADQMGMLATVINGLAVQNALQKIAIDARVMSAFQIDTVCERYNQRDAVEHLEAGRVVIFVAGTGNPFFTTDSAASLRAVEIGADLMIKATKVDGVYASDPKLDPTAKRFTRLTYNKAVELNLGVMDTTAIVISRDNNLPLRVLDMERPNALVDVINGQDIGTLIHTENDNG
ncbi:UMP kinase [Candidatus Halobeggiatoa sp. HSG11]|nr:UMP kinase [Candidatus Halobeggiatoa sp. HSG11]